MCMICLGTGNFDPSRHSGGPLEGTGSALEDTTQSVDYSTTFVDDYTALLSGQSWTGAETVPTVVTYSFGQTRANDETDSYEPDFVDSYQEFSASQQSMVRDILDDYTAVSGLIFVEDTTGGGDIAFGNYNFALHSTLSGTGFTGFAFYPVRGISGSAVFDSVVGGDVFIDIGAAGGNGYYLLAHEIGHALGLEHPFEGAIQLESGSDNVANTLMSYTGSLSSVRSLGPLDIDAVEQLYGPADFDPSDAGELEGFDYDTSTGILTQIWGSQASAIMGSSVIDQISAGSGDDAVAGLRGNDTLLGQDGSDTLIGGDGDDSLLGGDGTDSILGGAGNDLMGGGAGQDSLWGDDGDDAIFGAADNDSLNGENGNDTLGGASGDDILFGGAGDDELWTASGNDFASGGAGNDTLGGADGNDNLFGGDGDDEVWGSLGNDSAEGNDGNDTLGGSVGNDTLWGGDGVDELWGAIGDDMLDGDAGNDSVGAGAGDDVASGGDGNDTLFGGAGNDTLWGDGDDDLIFAGGGDDLLISGTGDDTLWSGDGADLIYFQRDGGVAPGADVLNDLSATDWIVIDSGIFGGGLTVAQVVANFGADQGADFVLDFGAGNSLTLVGQAGNAVEDQIGLF